MKLAGILGFARIRKYSAGIAKIPNWELGFGIKINRELGLGTPHHDPHANVQ